MKHKNLVNLLLDRQKKDKPAKGITFIDHPDSHHFVSYGELYQEALRVLNCLQTRGVKPGTEVVFQIHRNFDFLTVFWACLLGGMIPVPITVGDNDEYSRKLFNIWQVLKQPFLITFGKHLQTLEGFAAKKNLNGLFQHMKRQSVMVEDMAGQEGKGTIVIPQETDTAFIQFSSGSTGEPKGVVLTHKNLLTNINAIIADIKPPKQGDIFFSWMPLTHDMGIIGFHLVPLVAGWNHFLMPPQLFIRYPHLWLQEISRTKSTMTVSPNFGYKYVLKHFDPEKYTHLDLSCLRLVVNGAEPIHANVCEEFLNRFMPYGLKRNAMFPVYGLAEASLAVSFSEPEDEMVVVHIDRDTLSAGQQVRELGEDFTGSEGISFVEVGSAIKDCFIRIVDEEGNQVEDRVMGHIEIKGDNVTSGYYHHAKATKETIRPGGWLKTGDLGFMREGRLVITGRTKDLIFVSGQNIYAHDLERVAEGAAGIEFEKIAACGVDSPESRSDEIVCFVVFKRSLKEFLPLAAALKNHIIKKMGVELSRVIPVKKIPRTTSGKIQRFKLKKDYQEGYYHDVLEKINQLQNQVKIPKNYPAGPAIKELIITTWCEVLKREKGTFSEDDNFFDLGGNSHTALQVKARLQEALGKNIDDVALFKYPTINKVIDYLRSGEPDEGLSAEQEKRLQAFRKNRCCTREKIKENLTSGENGLVIAIIGMSLRFPGAKDIHEFWENLKNGIESISFFSEEELSKGGVDPQSISDLNYVKAKGVLEGIDYFDAAFFDYSPPEARKMDPQMRIFHECSWEALEDAGYDPGNYPGLIGVYVGASPNPRWESASILSPSWRKRASTQFIDTQWIDKDFMTTRLSYALNLTGPSFSMYTACSTSLVAVDLACQGLLAGRCDMALAGGASVWLPQKTGYLYEEGMIFSRDGHNRTFDKQASGTVFGDGAGIVLLKRLQDALEHRDHIYAVIKGSAINNDGRRKIGFTAPALEGQAEVIASALQMAGVDPESIGCLEAHGTATALGDTIEIDALKLAFDTPKKGYCAIGSVKSNVGHLNTAAGAVGLIKAVLSLKHRLIPPTLNIEIFNPRIDFENSPFYINTLLKEWKSNGSPLRAGVSSFGIGGTNSHVILEEAPLPGKETLLPSREYQLILLSAKTQPALDKMGKNLAEYLKTNPGINLEDMSYTLQMGRRHFQYKKMLVCSNVNEIIANLTSTASKEVYTYQTPKEDPTVVFLFPGQGSQYVNMGLELYLKESSFREDFDHYFGILQSLTDDDLKEIFYPSSPVSPGSSPAINRTAVAQPLLFIIEYALAKLLMRWGIFPDAMLGHSIGEYTAACLAGVFSLEDALKLVVLRGKLMQQTPTGAMLGVQLSEDELTPLLPDDLALAAVNAPNHCVVSGPHEAAAAFKEKMVEKGIETRALHTSHAFHSSMMEPILEEFKTAVKGVRLHPPRIRYISNLTGTWIREDEATNPGYWSDHLRRTVRFSDGIKVLLKKENPIFVEVGPGNALGTLVQKIKQNKSRSGHQLVNLLRHPLEKVSDTRYLLTQLGRLWLFGKNLDWETLYPGETRYRIPLPTYPFAGQHFSIAENLPGVVPKTNFETLAIGKTPDISDWFYIPVWKQSTAVEPQWAAGTLESACWLVFEDTGTFGSRVVKQLQVEGETVVTVKIGEEFIKESDGAYRIHPGQPRDYDILFRELQAMDRIPGAIIHLWGINPGDAHDSQDLRELVVNPGVNFDSVQERGFYSLVWLSQTLGKNKLAQPIRLIVVTSDMQKVTGDEELSPGKATVLASAININQEYPLISCRCIDIHLPAPGNTKEKEEKLVPQLLAEARRESTDLLVVYRNNQRWVRTFEPVKPGKSTQKKQRLKKNGVYLITGGLGSVGFTLARDLVKSGPKLVLIGRSPLPPEEKWSQWLDNHHKDDPISEKLRKVLELRKLGAEVLVFSADVADRQQMEMVIRESEERLGPIDGVIHAAGLVGQQAFHIINDLDKKTCQQQFQAKVHGLLTLAALFRDRKLDFCLLMSSISSVLGGFGLTAYSAANNFMDAFVAKHKNSSPFPWICVNWDLWQLSEEKEPDSVEFLDVVMGELSMTPQEGVEAFHRILDQEEDGSFQIIVSTGNLSARVRQWAKIKPMRSREKKQDSLINYVSPRNHVESIISNVIREHLGIDQVGVYDSFFDLGATSLDLVQINRKLNEKLQKHIPLAKLFTYTNTADFSTYLTEKVLGNQSYNKETADTGPKVIESSKKITKERSGEKKEKEKTDPGTNTRIENNNYTGLEIAVIGMAGRFPGARTVDEFWDNLKNGVESISFFADEELEESGVDSKLLKDGNYIKAKGVIGGVEYFDAVFFDYTPREAEMMDPQCRVFHECTWEALEKAGYDPYSYPGRIGLYIGANPHYYWDAVFSYQRFDKPSEQFAAFQLYDKDFMSTRISHKLNLKGPAFTMYTACSSSMVAIHLAVQALLSNECELALAGGVSIWLPEKSGYLYEDRMILSADGHLRAFDENASGSVFSDGAGVVVLKRLKPALDHGDTLYAMIKGSAINNDGGRKLAYTAPSVEGQADVITAALKMAAVEPESITYVETHGTATPLGDMVEMEALTHAFNNVKTRNHCAIGTVKTNVGHLNSAAGVAGFIKTVLALKHNLVPPSINFVMPNSKIDFDNSPFYINTQPVQWKNHQYPLRAGISSFGIGGTNAHVILEESPLQQSFPGGRQWKMIMLSAKNQESLEQATDDLVKFLKENPGINLGDAAYTLQVGRKHFQHRKMAVCQNSDGVVEALSSPDLGKVFTADSKGKKPVVIFMFPGQGSQYVNMGLELYQGERIFRQEMDRCFEILKSLLGYDIKEILYPHPGCKGESPYPPKDYAGPQGQGDHRESPLQPDRINQTEISQPVIFMLEYALGKLLISWGIHPEAMIGYSFGEYAAACLSGVLNLEDALGLVVVRGRLMQQMPGGAMLSVPIPLDQLTPLLPDQLSIAIDNGPSCIVSGSKKAIHSFEKSMKEKRYLCVPVDVTHASHSKVMTPILKEFEKEVRKIKFNPPQIPYISNVTAKLICASDVTDPLYWVKHLGDTVRFGEGLGELLEISNAVFVEVGPGRDLCVLLASQKNYKLKQRMINLVRHQKENVPDVYYLFNRVGHLWLYGVDIDWQRFYVDEKRNRMALPSYRFQGQPFLVGNVLPTTELRQQAGEMLQKRADIGDWFYIPVWKRSRIPRDAEVTAKSAVILLFMDEYGLGNKIGTRLKQEEYQVLLIRKGKTFVRINDSEYYINPSSASDYESLFNRLEIEGKLPQTVLHLWTVTPLGKERPGEEWLEEIQNNGFHSLIYLAQAWGKQNSPTPLQLKVVSNNIQDVTGGEVVYPEKAMLLGPVRTIGREYSNVNCCLIDLLLPDPGSEPEQELLDRLVPELKNKSPDEVVVAYRNGHRWLQTFETLRIEKPGNPVAGLREKGVYLITGGLGSLGFLLARYLAREVKAKLILTGRTALPGCQEWDNWLSTHDKGDKISNSICKIRELEALGAEVLVCSSDVCDFDGMAQVITRARECFGALNGVIHAAGLPDGAMIVRRTPEMSESILAPKVTGTLVLEKVLQESELDFFVLFSSIASILSIPGQVAYIAANAFLDAFASSRIIKNRLNPIAINWDRWQNLGTAAITENEYAVLLREEMETAMTAEEGLDVFNRILYDPLSRLPQVVISTTDIKTRIRRVNVLGLLPDDIAEVSRSPKTIRQRPELSVKYVEPGHETEKKLAEVWQRYLGIDRIGIHDNFFELGATSLDIIRVSSRLQKVFARDIPVVTIFSYPTIALLARSLNQEKPGENFFANEQRSLKAKDKGKKKLQYLKKRKDRRVQ